ncbi:MAG TPA: efflux transporter outer membrane subunit [Rhizomicrobium sp.]|nr:efflux transporter outer membrane subunit [Rhizomicrobium sp.]
MIAALLLTGCAVGPDFKKPAAPPVNDYTPHPANATVTSDVPGGSAQHFVKGADIAADWWTLFHSKPLNTLIEQALANNHDLKAAQAALLVAREHTAAQRAAFFPAVTGSFAASRQQQPQTLAPIPNGNTFTYNLFTPQVSVSYMPDVFGLTRRTVESYKAQEEQARYQLAAAYTTLINNVVAAAMQAGAVEAQIEATHQLIDANTKMVEILKNQFAKGYASRIDLAAQESQLAQTAATLPPLVKQQAQLHDQLAVLTGQYPSQAPEQKFELASLNLPADVPVSLPSRMVEQRPDVLQAQENMHAASAQIGVAIANRLPNIQLTANAGSTALAIGQVFGPGTGFWSLGSTLTATIFDGGALLHEERAARAAYVQAAEQYRSTVLNAFQNVADTLTALEQDAEGLKAAANAEAAARATLTLTQRRAQDGHDSYLSLLSAEQAYQQARISLIQAQVNRYTDTAALFQALGAGWWHRADLNGDENGE